MKPLLTAICVLLLLPVLAAPAAADAGSDLRLSGDYRLGEMSGMPHPASVPGMSFVRRDYPGTQKDGGPIRLKLRSLDPNDRFTVSDWDVPGHGPVFTGVELIEHGLPLPPNRNSSALVFQYAIKQDSKP